MRNLLISRSQEARSAIGAACYVRVEYVELRAEENLAPMQTLDRPGRLLGAAWRGDTRLIDNVEMPFPTRSHHTHPAGGGSRPAMTSNRVVRRTGLAVSFQNLSTSRTRRRRSACLAPVLH
ncbi:pantoate--beta-alanine ligase [Mesorhizobium sp.]|uniref:pantoate--beta-alanine ligase n=1 Tax=Mesorhizobium sp. TaxID=1871066 RepID=UPI001225E2B2|nr:pantoate--beta-alanine ligase [Mesorhizobium sp.]TIL38093.1 MAG: hypothetical protein E5Y82_15800 [Mesorhizobium sp.]